FFGFRLFDELDALFFQNQEQLIVLLGVDGVVGENVVDLAVRQVTLLFAGVEQRLETLGFIGLFHPTPPRKGPPPRWRGRRRAGFSGRSACPDPSGSRFAVVGRSGDRATARGQAGKPDLVVAWSPDRATLRDRRSPG